MVDRQLSVNVDIKVATAGYPDVVFALESADLSVAEKSPGVVYKEAAG